MVSVTVLVVVVVLVIEPCVKLGTTGTDIAVETFARADATTTIASFFFMFLTVVHLKILLRCQVVEKVIYHSIVNEVVTCPIADVPAPPGVTVTPPTVSIAPANVEVYVVPPSVVENVRLPAAVEV